MNQFGIRPGIILLREGTDTSQGIPQLISNINACQAVADAVRTTLGPAGRDKLVVTSNGRVTNSNDGATLMRLLEIQHPAAKMLVDISISQDTQVGLTRLKPLIEDGLHPQILTRHVRQATALAIQTVKERAVHPANDQELQDMHYKTACTALKVDCFSQGLVCTHGCTSCQGLA